MSKNEVLGPGKKDTNASKHGFGPIPNYVPDPDVVHEVETKIIIARTKLLVHQPFWGQLACMLEMQDASGWAPTAATDGRKFYYNVNFIQSLSREEIIFLFAHEILHCAYRHFMRRDDRDPLLWNAAADYAINGELKECNVGKMPECGLYDKKFLHYDNKNKFQATWGSEEIYSYLYENADKMPAEAFETLDVHMEPDNGSNGEGDGKGESGDSDSNGLSGGDPNKKPSMSDAEQKEVLDKFRNAVIQASENHKMTSGAGNLPGGIRRLIDSWTRPKIRWQDLLESNLKTQIKADYTWRIPHRRGELEGGILLPGNDVEECIKAHVAIDTSGSMTQKMLTEIMSELKGIMDSFTNYELHVWCFDTAIDKRSYVVFTQDNDNDIAKYQMYGGGGTMFEVNWDWMKLHAIEPDQLMFFTDGYPCGTWGEANYCDTIFCIHGDINRSIRAPFGLTVYYEDS